MEFYSKLCNQSMWILYVQNVCVLYIFTYAITFFFSVISGRIWFFFFFFYSCLHYTSLLISTNSRQRHINLSNECEKSDWLYQQGMEKKMSAFSWNIVWCSHCHALSNTALGIFFDYFFTEIVPLIYLSLAKVPLCHSFSIQCFLSRS